MSSKNLVNKKEKNLRRKFIKDIRHFSAFDLYAPSLFKNCEEQGFMCQNETLNLLRREREREKKNKNP